MVKKVFLYFLFIVLIDICLSDSIYDANHNGTRLDVKVRKKGIAAKQVFGYDSFRAARYPCQCVAGECGCCTGFLLATLNQKGCMNITYVPEDFSFKMALSFNDRVLYKNKVSGRNPPPMCVRVPRIRQVKFCARFSNVYFAGTNMHICMDADINWDNYQLFQMSFDCFRFGTDGIGYVSPEDGGGLATINEEDGDEEIEEYDEDA